MTISSDQITSVQKLFSVLLIDDSACLAVASAAERLLSSSDRDSVFAVLPRARHGVSYGSADSDAVANVQAIIAGVE
jgi:hypothetical protein